MSEHRSVWLATSEHPRFPPLDGDLDVDVAVVGGGITGITAALLLRRDGHRVALVEGRRLGEGTTGNTTGKVTSQHGLTYADLVERHGEHRARLYADANQAAVEVVAGLASEVDDDCQLRRAPSFAYVLDPSRRAEVEAEHEAAVRLGLPASLTTDVDLPFAVEQAVRFDDQIHLHPSRYTAGLVRLLVAEGGHVVEDTRAIGAEEADEHVAVHTSGGTIRAQHLVVATLLPFLDRGGFFARAQPVRAYGVSVRLRSGGVDGMHIDVGPDGTSTRPWVDGDQPGLIVVGSSHPVGERGVGPRRWGDLEAWTREHFDVASIEHRWSSQDYVTVDDVPYVGRSPMTERVHVATGFKKWGLTNGTAAARMVSDLIAGRDNPWIEAFDATRVGDPTAVKDAVVENLQVGARFIGDRIARLRADDVDDLPPGEGRMVKIDGRTAGAYRAPDGSVTAVSITCTHMGCTLQWNGAETSWDCPCHGSRFAADGAVLDGPAVRPLAPIEVDTPE